MNYKISVIMPIYNGESSLMKTVDSIINQTIGFNNIELILVDDKSKDNSKQLIENLSVCYENIKPVFIEKNSGSPGKPRNIGVQNAKSKYVMFIDCGDTYSKDICEIFYNTIEKEKVDLVACSHRIYFDGLIQDSINFLDDNVEFIFNPNNHENFFKDTYMWNKIFRKDIIIENKIQCLEEGFPEDSYFIINYLFNISKCIFLNDYHGYNYIVPESSEDNNSMSRTVDKKKILDYILGFSKIIELIKENGNKKVLELICNGYMLVLISYFAKFKSNFKHEKEIINEIFLLEQVMEVSIQLNQKWAKLINNAILCKNYRKAIFYARIIFILQNSSFLKKIYRKRINKKSIF